jgi:phage repressor protein C with HTH and peptisase S24 domain
MTLGERIRAARKDAGFTSQQRLADAIGCTREAVTMWETDKVDAVGGDYLPALARALRISAEYIQTGKESARASSASNADRDWRNIQGYAQAVGLGNGVEAQEYAETHSLKFRAASLSRKRLQVDNLHVFYGDGDSMEPRIRKGDAIMFDESDTRITDDTIYVIQWRGEYYVKRAMILDTGTYFITDNKAGDHNWKKAKNIADKDPIKVIGRVRWIGSWED